ncbi:hypothetical protein [Pseudomonas aeruginosa]|uniref:hypothetical protein n=1 Tax=Pseudomonas aeruginosa TaxID=287 RepID=UPI000E30FF00|nr:hypothetical protein [Pseudomonas aeruginosa]NPY29724.1 hypothetical protein [Pseudomonas aeruginosa]HEP9008119.1 hypothetical protein [Pseudomonas aeruginosa]HEP9406557.1 hypothetical protein [Pseudomonas aeruginosa]
MKLTPANILSNAWAFYAEDIMVRIDAMQAEEERQMRECMGNRDNYDIEEIQKVVAYNERHGWARRANIARAILAERLAEIEVHSVDIAFATESEVAEIRRVEAHNEKASTMRQLIELRDRWEIEGRVDLHAQTVGLINEWAGVMLAEVPSMRQLADKALHDAGFRDYALKVKECKGASFPAYDVWVRPAGAARGRLFMTLIYPDFRVTA